MIIKLLDKTELVIPDTEAEYVKLVDLHDLLGVHEPVDSNYWSTQCRTCGAQLINCGDGIMRSLLATSQNVSLQRRLGEPDQLLAKEAVNRRPALIGTFADSYGANDWMWNFIDGLSDADITKQEFLGKHLKICDESEERIKDMHRAKSQYVNRLYAWSNTIKASAKKARKAILARNKEIWQTLKGHYGAERQAMIDELELGIKRRKELKAKENAAIEKLKSKRHGW